MFKNEVKLICFMDLVRHAYVYEGAMDLLDEFRERDGRISKLVVVGADGTEGLARGENNRYNLSGLTDSVRRIRDDSRANAIGLPSDVSFVCDQTYSQMAYHFLDGTVQGSIATFEEKSNSLIGRGIILMGLNTNVLALMMRAYGLPFPENFKAMRT